MIDHLSGRLRGEGREHVVVECAGVGFRVYASAATRADLPAAGEAIFLRTYLHLREGAADLFGFSTEAEREIFLALIGVGGVGPKSAISVLSTLGVGGVVSACAAGDADAFTRVPGIGKKLAQRIANELPDRLKKVSADLILPAGAAAAAGPSTPEGEAVEALTALGFSPAEARQAVARALRSAGGAGERGTEAIVREALAGLSKAGG